jgi:hypothetical protein
MSDEQMIVEETFNIFKDGRRFNPAPQAFALGALKQVLNAPETKERIALGEAIGYWGHRPRELTGKMFPTEMEVVNIDGKAVVLTLEPTLRTLDVSVDEAGNVTHRQQFFDTELGRKAYALYKQGQGGFSWAMNGRNGHGAPSVATKFAGFDYVQQPNFIPLQRQTMLLSSVAQGLSLSSDGVDEKSAGMLLSAFAREPEADAQQYSDMLLSAMIEQDTKRQKLLERVLDKAPVFINEDQRRAFLRMANDDDAAIVGQLLSSLHSTDLSQFPATIKQATAPTKARPDADTVELAGYLGPTRKFPGQR